MAEIQSGIDSARFYISRGLFPIPAPWGEKGSRTPGWQKLRLTLESDLELYFGDGRQNIGLILGDPRNLCDVDLDAPEARWAWTELGLETGFVFGHRSNPASHHFFYAEPAVKTIGYDDPAPGERKKRLIELRSLGGFQLAPPSQHPSGEPYEFTHSGQPALIEAAMLEAAVAHSAAAILVARHAKEGTRHFVFLALAGALARAGWHRERTENLVHAIYGVLWREAAKMNDADREVNDSYDHYEEGKETTGLPTLRNLLDGKVFDALAKWLRLDASVPPPKLEPLWTGAPNGAAAAQPAPETPPHEEAPPPPPPPPPRPKKLPDPARLIGGLQDQVLRAPIEMIQSCVTQPGVTLVNASNKAGKTVLTIQMLMSVASGQPFLEWFKVNQASVLLFQWDDLQGEIELQQYLSKARASKPGMPFFYVTPGEDPITLQDPEFLPFLRSEIQRTGAQLVALDSYSALRGARSRGGDVVKLDADDILLLQKVALELNCAILLIHHDSKSSAALDWASRGAGSYAIGAASDAIIYLTRYPELAEDEGSRMVSIRSRRMKGAEFCVRYRAESKDFDLIFEGPGARDYPEVKKLYRAFPSVAFLHPEASEALGVSKPTVYRVCSRLVASGVLRKEPTGWKFDPNFDRSRL